MGEADISYPVFDVLFDGLFDIMFDVLFESELKRGVIVALEIDE